MTDNLVAMNTSCDSCAKLEDKSLHSETVERQLLEVESRYRSLVDASPDAILIVVQGVVAFVSRAALTLFGAASAQQLVGVALRDLMEVDVGTGVAERARALASAPQSPALTERVCRRLDGRLVEVEVASAALLHAGQFAIHLVLRDITARRLGERALRNSEERYRNLFENAPVGMVMLDADGALIRTNPAFCNLLGLPAGTWRRNNLLDLVHEEDQAEVRTLLARLAGGQEHSAETERRCVAADGRTLWLRLEVRLLDEDSAGSANLVMMAEDVSARRRAEVALLSHNAELERCVGVRTAELHAALREQEAFSYTVSHDLRGPVRAVEGFTNLVLEDQASVLSPQARHWLSRVVTSSARMNNLIDGVLELSKLGRTTVKKVRIAMRAMAAEVADELRESDARRIELTIGALPDADGDPVLLRQVWQNLLGNAFKFTSRCAAPRIEIDGAVEGDWVRYTVRDNGAGFSPAFAQRMFELFERMHSESEFSGTGVGLAIVRRALERQGGSIRAEGWPGEGAIFTFSLPAGPP